MAVVFLFCFYSLAKDLSVICTQSWNKANNETALVLQGEFCDREASLEDGVRIRQK